jgi:cytochrome bd-type quinol oxidase subunit 2
MADVMKDPIPGVGTVAAWPLNSELARTVPYWFLATVGFIYASGFVVVTTFLETYGLRDIGTDFWKARYIHVGVLCAVFPLVLVITAGLLIHLVRSRQRTNPRPFTALRLANVLILFLTVEISFYFYVMFSRRDDPAAEHAAGFAQLEVILLVAFLLPAVILIAENFLKHPSGSW